ncbi:unnamed protein product [Absidia cylindrospora]
MKTILAFSIALFLQTISAASTAAAETPSSSSSSQLDSAVAVPTAVGDKMAQEMLEKYEVFRWENNNTFAQESFEFQLNEPTMLQVVDFKHHGDMFDVYDNGKQIGSSSKVVYDEDVETYAATPQEALTDDHFSKGSFNLDKGQHNITILAHGPYEAGSAAIRLVQRTNLVLAKGEQEDQPKEHEEEEKKPGIEEQEEEEEEEVEEEEEEDKEENTASVKKNDLDNWKKMFLKKKTLGDKHYKHNKGAIYPNKKKQQYHDQQYKHHYKNERPAYYKDPRVGPKIVTHWKVVRKTAVPYATKVVYEKKDY